MSTTNLWAKFRNIARVSKAKSVCKRNDLQRRLSLETLEQRRVLSVSPNQVVVHDSSLYIYGSDDADTALVTEVDGRISVQLEAGGESLSLDVAKSQVNYIRFYGREGDDQFTNLTTLGSRAIGEAGNDTLTGGSGIDDFDGGEGNDSLSGGGHNDILRGGLNNDLVKGDAGTDTIYGNDGDDILYGGADADLIRGGTGIDRLYGDQGDDRLYGDEGNDSLAGGSGNDDLRGGDENDTLQGGTGNDVLTGDLGNDLLYGDEGNDALSGIEGNDTLKGGDGNDTLRGGNGNDSLNGHAGDDKLFGDAGVDSLVGEEGADELYGGDSNDKLSGGSGINVLKGEDGDDTLFGGDDAETIYGGDGNDFIRAGSGDDTVYGGLGSDYLNGQDGDDKLFGEAGEDTLVGEFGADELYGGEGNDTLQDRAGANLLQGENGDDVIFGGDDADTIYGGEGHDTIRGGEGNDSLRGGVGNDFIYGQGGNDRIFGEAGVDSLAGDEGDDEVNGGDDDDRITGGLGADILRGEGGDDLLSGDEDNDTLYGSDGVDQLYGGSGNDSLRGGLGTDWLAGEAGDDALFGEEDVDQLIGGDGDDQLSGGDDSDLLQGGEGEDRLSGEAGNDILQGDGGIDWLLGGVGDDHLVGGSGDDRLRGEDGNDELWGNEGNDSLYGHGGNDFLSGGLGDDYLWSEEGDDILLGDEGADTLEAGAGADLLVGGEGVDSLNGSMGEDLLIGGLVSYDAATLKYLLATWASAATYHDRVHAIEDESFAAFLQSEETVFDDYVVDSVIGGTNLDWFFVPGVVSIYDPNADHAAHNDGGQQHHSSGHHGVHIIDHLPIVEGADLLDSLDKLADVDSGEYVHTLIPHADDPSKRREHLSLFELVRYDEVTHFAIRNGNWSDASTWHDGVVPPDGARVLIPIGVEVTINRKLDTEIGTVRVDGTLSFATNVHTRLKVDTIIVSDVGLIEIGTADNPIAANVTAELKFTDTGSINRDWDPFGISRGLITHGAVSMYGAEVTSSLELVGPVAAGASSLRLASLPVGWRVGDKVVIAGTAAGEQQSEERTIRAIAGNMVTIDALQYSHLTLSSSQSVHIANLTRNILIDSEAIKNVRRGHVMFMHNPNVHISNVNFYRLGRTDKREVINDPVVDANWNLVPGTGTNPRARYAVHFHRTGTLATGTPATVEGSVVTDNLGWGFVNHSSYVNFTSNVAYNVTGAGFVTEVGDEIGTFRENIAINMKASGDDIEARLLEQDHGHTGDGFWFQGAGISVVDNVVANAEGHAFIFYTRGLEFGGQKAQFLTANLPDPSIANGDDSIMADHVPVIEFSGNLGYSSGIGLSVWYNLRDADHDARSIFRDSLFWNNEVGVEVPYSHSTILLNLAILHDFSTLPSIGVKSNAVTKDTTYDNLLVSGYHFGIDVARRGYSIVIDGAYATRYGVLVRPAAEPGRTVLVRGNFRMLPIPSEVLGGGTQIDVVNKFEDLDLKGSISHLFFDSRVVLNYGLYRNQQLYNPAQMASAIPFPVSKPHIPSELVGLTTLQIKNQLGLSLYGEIAPATAQFIPNLGGLLQIIL